MLWPRVDAVPLFAATLASHMLARLLIGAPREPLFNWESVPKDVKMRMQQASEETFRKIVPAWQMVNDTAVLLYFCWAASMGNSIPMFLWAPLGCSFYLTACHYGHHERTRDTVVLSFLGFFTTVGMPREFGITIAMIRLLLNSWLPCPTTALLMQVALEPGFLAEALRREGIADFAGAGEQVLSEIVLLGGLVLAHYKQQTHLFHQIKASVQAETSMQQISSLGDAAKRLLTVTCDACTSLSQDLQILKPSASLRHLLGDVEGQCFLDFMDEKEKLRVRDFIATPREMTPATCHVQILSAGGMVNAEIFHVKIGGGLEDAHFVGITLKEEEKVVDVRDDHQGQDMKFLLGYNDRSPPPSSASLRRDVEEISHIHFLVNSMTPELGLLLQSVTFDFELSGEQKRDLPNLLEWVLPSSKQEVLQWVQDTVNAIYGGRSTSELHGVKFFCPQTQGSLVGQLRGLDIYEDNEDSVQLMIEVANLQIR